MKRNRLNDLVRFYNLLAQAEKDAGGPKKFSDWTSKTHAPKRGVYFIQEPGQSRRETGSGLRIVRVGTHALTVRSRTTLMGRLKQHKGNIGDGSGNHRGSIFRLLLGKSLIIKDTLSYDTWGRGSSASRDIRESEKPLESRVSELISNMYVIWIGINDDPGPDSLRGYIEENSIALLSNFERTGIDQPSYDWLGNHCDRLLVRNSGLWNSRHVNQDYDPKFLDVMETLR